MMKKKCFIALCFVMIAAGLVLDVQGALATEKQMPQQVDDVGDTSGIDRVAGSSFNISDDPFSSGQGQSSFSEAAGLKLEEQPIEYRDGLSPEYHSTKQPGIPKYGNITMKRGAIGDTGKSTDTQDLDQGFIDSVIEGIKSLFE